MKKIIAMALTCTLAVSAIAGFTALADDEPIKVFINGEELVIPEGDTQPFIEDSRTLVPMRAIFEALGAKVNWDGETKTIVSYDPISDVSITMQIDSANMFVGETKVELDVPAKIVNDRTVVPVRAIAEGMNSVVGWDGETRTVTVTKDITKTDEPTATEEPSSQIANPWTEYATLDELNAAINEQGEVKYQVADPKTPAVVNENGYRYLAESNMAEIVGRWEVGAGGDLVIRTCPTDTDISGINGGQKVEDFKLEDGTDAQLWKYENTVYAFWANVNDGTAISYSVAITAEDWDPTEVVKTLANEVETGNSEAE